MAKNYLDFQTHGVRSPIDDNRWRVNTSGMEDCRNATLVITDAIKAEGPHREGGWLKSGVPVYYDDGEIHGPENKGTYFYTDAGSSGTKVDGFLVRSYKITDENGEFYDTVPVAVQTRGEVICQWLPVEKDGDGIPDVTEFDNLPPRFTNTWL